MKHNAGPFFDEFDDELTTRRPNNRFGATLIFNRGSPGERSGTLCLDSNRLFASRFLQAQGLRMIPSDDELEPSLRNRILILHSCLVALEPSPLED